MKKKLYGGKLTLQVFTTVDANEDSVQERNNAHEDLDFHLFEKLRNLVESKGYHVDFTGANLHCIEDANEIDIDFVTKMKEAAKKRSDEYTRRIQF